MLERLRQSRRSAAARFGTAFACAWLAFAALPCAAFGMGVAGASDHALMNHAATVPAGEPACPHCPPVQHHAGCGSAHDFGCNALGDALLAKSASSDLVLAAPPSTPNFVTRSGDATRVARVTHDTVPPSSVPLNLRYCTAQE